MTDKTQAPANADSDALIARLRDTFVAGHPAVEATAAFIAQQQARIVALESALAAARRVIDAADAMRGMYADPNNLPGAARYDAARAALESTP